MIKKQLKNKQSTLLGFFKKKEPANSNSESAEQLAAVLKESNSAADPVQLVHKQTAKMPFREEEDGDDCFIKPNPKRLKSGRIVDSDDEDMQIVASAPSKTHPGTPSLSSLKEYQMNSDVSSSAFKSTPASSRSFPTATPKSTATPSFGSLKSAYSSSATPASQSRAEKFKEKNDERYSWLLNIKDVNGNLKGHIDYDPRTLHIPQSAWNKFTPFEKQFWEIKSKHYDTVVFFKKGKFFELYENDADIGHQQFDLKLTDRYASVVSALMSVA